MNSTSSSKSASPAYSWSTRQALTDLSVIQQELLFEKACSGAVYS